MTAAIVASVVSDFTDWLDEVASNWWFLIVILVVAFLDSIIPIVPSETTVILGGVAAGAGDQQHRRAAAAGLGVQHGAAGLDRLGVDEAGGLGHGSAPLQSSNSVLR
jgi:hypothetical protein